MRTRRLAGLVAVLALLICPSCSDDSDDGVRPDPSPYKDLTQRDHVLANLELAYTSRDLEEFVELLDEGFVFDLAVQQWDRDTEIAAAANMFDENFSKPGVNPITEIELTLTYEEGNDGWEPVIPDDQETYPDETWYKKTVTYDFRFTTESRVYSGNNIQATFVVRQSQVAGTKIWRIVSWADDTHDLMVQSYGNAMRDPSTWGKIRALPSV